MLGNREWQILNIFVQDQEKYISSQEIGKMIGVSDKTARKYTNYLKNTLELHGAELIAKQGHGYKLIINQWINFNMFIENEKRNHLNSNRPDYFEESINRERYIFNQLLLENERLTMADIEDRLFISSSSASKLLGKIRDKLRKYHLKLSNTKKGLTIRGSELKQRKFIIDYFFTDELDVLPMNYLKNSIFDNSIKINEITIIVLDEIRDAKLNVSDFIITNLVMHIALAILRLKNNKQIDKSYYNFSKDQKNVYEAATKITKRLSKIFSNIRIPLAETEHIALHLISKGDYYQKYNNELKNDSRRNIDEELLLAIKNFSQIVDGRISIDPMLINGLDAHFKQLRFRLDHQIEINNPVLTDIKERYTQEHYFTKKCFSKMSLLNGFQISEEEWAYVTLHMLASVERYKNETKTRILVVCATGVGSAQMMKSRLENEFKDQIIIVDVISYYELNEENIKNIDLIVSSLNMDEFFIPVPIVTVSVLINDKDIKNIRKYISSLPNNSVLQSQKENFYLQEAQHIFEICFDASRCIWVEDHIDKRPLLKKMINLLKEDKMKNQFLNEIDIREAYGPVAFNNFLAVPHPVHALTKREKVVVAFVKSGVYWNSQNPNVKVVILLSPSKYSNDHLGYLSSALSYLMQDNNMQKKLAVVENYEDFRKIMCILLSRVLN